MRRQRQHFQYTITIAADKSLATCKRFVSRWAVHATYASGWLGFQTVNSVQPNEPAERLSAPDSALVRRIRSRSSIRLKRGGLRSMEEGMHTFPFSVRRQSMN